MSLALFTQGLTPTVAVSGIPGATVVSGSAQRPAVHPGSPLAVIRQIVAAGGLRKLYTGGQALLRPPDSNIAQTQNHAHIGDSRAGMTKTKPQLLPHH